MPLLRLLGRHGVRRGLMGGSRAWTVVGGAALALRAARAMAARNEKVVYREQLAPGESLVITHQPRSTATRSTAKGR